MSPMSPRLLRPILSGFDPRRIAGLVAWWDFADSASLGPTDSGVGAVSNNGPVKYARDKSGNGNHLTQPGADSVSPTLVENLQNGRPALSFDGGDWLRNTTSNTFMVNPFTLFIVCSSTNTTTGQRVISVHPNRSFLTLNTGAWLWQLNNAGSGVVTGLSMASVGILGLGSDGDRVSNIYRNGTKLSNFTTAAVTPGGLSVGAEATNGTNPFTGVIYEIILYARRLTDAEIARINKHLGRKWGITVA